MPGETACAGRGAGLPWGRLAGALLVLLAALAPPGSLGASESIPKFLRERVQHPAATVFEALSECDSSLPEELRWDIADTIERESRRHGYDPLFVQAMVEIESTCSPKAKSRKGALGLFQLLPSTARAVARAEGLNWKGPQSLFDPVYNVQVGLLYLSHLENQLGDLHRAVAAYNLGPGRASRMSHARIGRNGYLRKILSRYEDLVDQYADASGQRLACRNSRTLWMT